MGNSIKSNLIDGFWGVECGSSRVIYLTQTCKKIIFVREPDFLLRNVKFKPDFSLKNVKFKLKGYKSQYHSVLGIYIMKSVLI